MVSEGEGVRLYTMVSEWGRVVHSMVSEGGEQLYTIWLVELMKVGWWSLHNDRPYLILYHMFLFGLG